MTDRRPYQNEKHIPQPSEDTKGIFVPIDSASWKRPRILTLENLAGYLTVEVEGDINVTSVDYVNQSDKPELPPNTFPVNTRAHIAIDDNYLYVWVESQKRWKRTILSVWE